MASFPHPASNSAAKIAAQMLEKKGIPYEKVYVEDNVDLAKELGLKQAPTLMVSEGDNHTLVADLPDVKKFIESL